MKKKFQGLYREDKNLEVTIIESAEAKVDKREEIKLRQEKRVVDEINKRADLNKDRAPRTIPQVHHGPPQS